MNEIENEVKKMVEGVIEENEEMENDEFLRQYNEVLDEALGCLSGEQSGSQERKNEAEVIEKLVKAKIAYMQYLSDARDKEERRRIEEVRNKENARIEDNKARRPISDRIWDLGGKVLLGALNCGVSVFMLKLILEFEENGTLRSKPGREFRIFQPMNLFKG